ncbi:hypothetical protein [Methanobrevibacter arboriphilus]|uniref:hypothetical protein n=1 Tax=Methanobrevibacter arboriphilus TaxID=39441 RepID=UPI001CDABC73|nr:hypothetical protein [Methanobrevibacter arboriphilus]
MIVWIGEIIVFYLLADIGIGLTIDSLITAILVIIILETINSIFWPALTKIFLPFFSLYHWNRFFTFKWWNNMGDEFIYTDITY